MLRVRRLRALGAVCFLFFLRVLRQPLPSLDPALFHLPLLPPSSCCCKRLPRPGTQGSNGFERTGRIYRDAVQNIA